MGFTTKDEIKDMMKKVLKKTLTSQQGNDYDNVPFKFGVDADGNYGYIKDGADTVTPFKSSGCESHYYEYMQFSNNPINLNFTIQSNYTIEVCFDAETYNDQEVIFGNTNSYNYSHLTLYSGKYFFGCNGERNFGSYASGKHTFILNDNDNNAVFDDQIVSTSISIGGVGSTYTIGGNRPNGSNYYGKIYYFKVTDKTTGEIVHNIVPLYTTTTLVFPDGYECPLSFTYMYDKITHTKYSSGFSVGGNIIE